MSLAKHSNHAHHVTPIKTLIGTFLALVALMLLTVWSSTWNFSSPIPNNAINLGIAVIKATLVVRIFMGYAYTTSLAKLFALAGFVWLLLITITFGDYFTRKWEYTPGWNKGDVNGGPAETDSTQTALSKAYSLPDFAKKKSE